MPNISPLTKPPLMPLQDVEMGVGPEVMDGRHAMGVEELKEAVMQDAAAATMMMEETDRAVVAAAATMEEMGLVAVDNIQ